ncbi:MAG: thioredoxin-disulfide reductase [Candidatus Shapirobacteria bacterium]|nr:thioredoxin-disulfide reductase [Candidatus Shapirobacteria bacterium]MDD3002721.1 thioredoxin-disulfide reductase [Candidatus Shapirobacteria bacterium]MDD4382910.1 thioredoxin-disulfide reductase [Candidatus Shapirobacteria bacterium]
MNENIKYDCVIIGSGPAGLTAAIYQARADIKTIVIAGNQPGGQLTITPMVENYPGFPDGVGGFKLMMDTQTQVKKLGVEIKGGLVHQVHQVESSSSFEVELESGEVLQSKTVIVATGAGVKWLGLPKEQELIGHGISSCATCDGMFFRDKTVAVVGGGDTACEDAVFLAKFTKKVFMIVRREEFRASAAEQKKVLDNEKIEIWWSSEVKELNGEEKLESVKILNNKTEKETILPLDGMFVAVGYSPATKFLEGLVKLKEMGQIVVGKNEKLVTMASVEGIFAAGDCVNENHRQAILAAGEGCRAALETQKWLKER